MPAKPSSCTRASGQRAAGSWGSPGVRASREITIESHGINVEGVWLRHADMEKLAYDDGFDSFEQLLAFFEKEHHRLPFRGLLIMW